MDNLELVCRREYWLVIFNETPTGYVRPVIYIIIHSLHGTTSINMRLRIVLRKHVASPVRSNVDITDRLHNVGV